MVEASRARNALAVAASGQVCARVFELLLPTLAVIIASQTIAHIEQVIGWTAPAYFLYGVGALPAGLIADRLSARLLLIIGIFGSGVAALAASEAPNGHVLSMCLGVMGLCASVCRPAGVALLQRTTPDWRHANRLAVWAGRAAIVSTPALVAAIGSRVGWHPTLRFIGYALCSLAVGAAFLPVGETALPARPRLDARGAWARLTAADLLTIAAAALAATAALGVALIEPWYLATRVTSVGFGLATSAVVAVGILGRIALSRLAVRVDGRRAYLIWHMLAIGALLLMTTAMGGVLLIAAAVFAAASLAARGRDDYVLARIFSHRSPAVAAGMAAAWTGGVAALAVTLVAASAGTGARVTLLWLTGIDLLAMAAAAMLVSMPPDLRARAPLAVEPSDSPFALLPAGTHIEPPPSC